MHNVYPCIPIAFTFISIFSLVLFPSQMVYFLPVLNMDWAVCPPHFGDPRDSRVYAGGVCLQCAKRQGLCWWACLRHAKQHVDLERIWGPAQRLQGGGDQWRFPWKKPWHYATSNAKEHGSPNMAYQVQQWALLHSGPWRAFVCPGVHMRCVGRPVHQMGMNWEECILQLHWMPVRRTFLFRCTFCAQCTLKLITLPLRYSGSAPSGSPLEQARQSAGAPPCCVVCSPLGVGQACRG